MLKLGDKMNNWLAQNKILMLCSQNCYSLEDYRAIFNAGIAKPPEAAPTTTFGGRISRMMK